MCKLHLNKSDCVRNINKRSIRFRWEGVVFDVDERYYHVVYGNGLRQTYLKALAHHYLEPIEPTKSNCTCVHDDLCDRCARQVNKALTIMERYGAGHKAISEAAWTVLMFERPNGRKVLNRERRNVITGQDFRILEEAMCNPGIAIRYEDVDHAISEGIGNRLELNKHFDQVLRDTIGGRKGFTFERGHVTFNPIVTEETYVTQ
ncbi:hypothetical protein SP6_11 [Salmonella phage SP6]|uniref:Uncharacterized protein n=2 Tax=Enterobacteria phage SP6 TaxID=2907955 RepID=Q7Y5Q9_BPSP6|nr:gp11 [Salmonella phage SP6]AAP48750.1 gp11 [Salmonella phage SP6]AAR90002.1 10 [Salmonella phage SP6]